MKGLKIEFEGTDGAGKTTGLQYFVQRAREERLTVVETREVGNPHIPTCVKLRELVLDPNSKLTGEAMELIFSAMRFENDAWLTKLRNSPECPDLIVSDRGWASHLAYTDHNVTSKFTEDFYLNFVGKNTSMPDIIHYFSVNTDTALKRRQKRGTGMDVIEMKGIEYQEKVRDSFRKYLTQMTEDGVNVFVVHADDNLEGVQRQLDDLLNVVIDYIKK